MKTKIYPCRKGSRAARIARKDCIFLAVVCLVAAVVCALSDGYMEFFPRLLGGTIALLLLASLFRILGCIAFDLETIAATKEVDYTEEDEDDEDGD